MSSTARQASQFAVIGGIGFVVDASVLAALHHGLQFDIVWSRVVSFAIAVTVTWYLNRHNTFSDRKDDRAGREWGRYAAVNTFGAALNMAIFFSLVFQFEALRKMPLIPLAIASAVVMVVNFLASKHLAFTGNED